MLSLVKLPELKAVLNGEDLAKHSIWETISVPPTEKARWQTHTQMSALMYRVLACTLLSMPAYTNLALELPSDGLWPDWEGVHAWLELQLPDGMRAPWDAHWATPVTEAMRQEVSAACRRIKAARRMHCGAACTH